MGEPAKRRATYDDVLNAPEGMVAEILAGELFLSPRPTFGHGYSATSLSADLTVQFGRPTGDDPWWIIVEPELHLGKRTPKDLVMVPDIAGWRRSRVPAMTDVPGVTTVPDWVCEVVSGGPRNARRDRIIKAELYHQVGVPWMWLVDPEARMIEVYQHAEAGWTRVQVHAGDEDAQLRPFDSVSLAVANWWLNS